jgi:hypothetical protein
MIQIITGQGPFHYHHQLSDKDIDTTCSLCLEYEESGADLALECPT